MKHIAIIFSLVLLCSCASGKKICGTYQGTLPAADGPGIATTITFGQDHSYTEELIYIDKDDGTFIENGKYRITDNTIELISVAGEKSYYKIEDGSKTHHRPSCRLLYPQTEQKMQLSPIIV